MKVNWRHAPPKKSHMQKTKKKQNIIYTPFKVIIIEINMKNLHLKHTYYYYIFVLMWTLTLKIYTSEPHLPAASVWTFLLALMVWLTDTFIVWLDQLGHLCRVMPRILKQVIQATDLWHHWLFSTTATKI